MMQTTEPVRTQWQAFEAALDALCDGRLRPAEFSAQVRGYRPLREALPPRYVQVLDELLDRLEAGALFTEESCSFSQEGLLEHLRQWAAHAQTRLNMPG